LIGPPTPTGATPTPPAASAIILVLGLRASIPRNVSARPHICVLARWLSYFAFAQRGPPLFCKARHFCAMVSFAGDGRAHRPSFTGWGSLEDTSPQPVLCHPATGPTRVLRSPPVLCVGGRCVEAACKLIFSRTPRRGRPGHGFGFVSNPSRTGRRPLIHQ